MKIIESNEVTDRSSTELLDAKLGLNSAEYPMVNSEVRPLAKRVADIKQLSVLHGITA